MPNKRKKVETSVPNTFRGEYTFVNKEASNIGSKDHSPAVAWHVMNRYERWKKTEATKSLRSSADVSARGFRSARSTPSQSPGRDPISDLLQVKTGQDAVDDTTQNISVGNVSPMSMMGFETSSGYNFIGASPSFNIQRTGADTSNYLHVGTTAEQIQPTLTTDIAVPSASTALEALTHQDLLLPFLEFAHNKLVPEQWPIENGYMAWHYEKQRSYGDIAAVNYDASYANALLALISRLQFNVTHDNFYLMQAKFFKDQANQELQLQSPSQIVRTDLPSLTAILKLFLCESCDDNTAAARALLKCLQRVISQAGGVILFDSWFQENLLSCDAYFGLKCETRPLFTASEWSPGSLSIPWKTRLANARVADDHGINIHSIIDHAILRSIIKDLRELFQVQEYLNSHRISNDDQLLRWKQMRKYDCISRLADHQLNLKIFPHLFSRPTLQRTACVAIALMAAMILGCPEPVRFGLKLLADLRNNMPQTLVEIQSEGQTSETLMIEAGHFVLWTTYVAFLAERVHPVPEASRRFHAKLKVLLTEIDMTLEHARNHVFAGFLFSRSLEEEINAGRPYRKTENRAGLFDACGTSWREPFDQAEFGVMRQADEGFGKGKEREL